LEDLWPFLSIVFVVLMLVLLVGGKKGGKFTRRIGAIMVGVALLLFVFSGLFLANTVINPAESLLYQVGLVLCFAVAPTLLVSGIFALATAPRVKKEEYVAMQQISAASAREGPVADSTTCPVDAEPNMMDKKHESSATPLPKWEQRARKIYGIMALLLLGLLALRGPLILLGFIILIPYIIFFIYLLTGKRNLVVSLFFLLLWYVWFSPFSGSMSLIHFSQVFMESMKKLPYFGPLEYNVWWMFYSMLMFSGVILLLFSALSNLKKIEKIMTGIFTAKTCVAILTVPMILMFVLPPGFVTNPNLRHPSVVSVQATDIGINEGRTERYFNETSGEWVYSIAIRYNGDPIITNISLGGKVISPPFDNSAVMITEYDDDVTPNFSNSGVIVIRDKAFVSWVSLVSRNALGEAIYGIGWF